MPVTESLAALATFSGVARRLQVLLRHAGAVIYDDFAHHPTAIAATLATLRGRAGDGRVIAVFEPRSLTAGRQMFHQPYREAFEQADRVFLAPIFHAGRLEPEDRLDLARLAGELSAAGVPTESADSIDDLLGRVQADLRPGDVVVTMSSGDFGGMARRLAGAA